MTAAKSPIIIWPKAAPVPVGQLATSANATHLFHHQALNAGTTGAVEPVFTTMVGGTVVDNGITWQCVGPMERGGNGTGSD
jgi:hypothetical protein